MNSQQTLKNKKKICLSGCRYDVVCRVALELGFKIVPEHEVWNINWSDAPLAPEKVMEMRRLQNANAMSGAVCPFMQKMNHFPGMYEICRKDRLGRNLNRLKRVFSEDYNFFPSTWDLPHDMPDLMNYWRRNRNATFIVKPESGCQGKGIFLVKNVKMLCPFAKCVCQLYASQPFLLDGYKYDQRIYVLITCVDPLRVYVYNEGIARFATVKYSMPNDQNLDVVFMHLTNYSLNKFSESINEGSKRKLSSVYAWMKEQGHDIDKLTAAIDDIIVKTVICAAPTLRHNYRTSFPKREHGCSCFELLGFDILVDRHLKPMLVEVNHSPSFNLDLPVDNEVKTDLLRNVFAMVNINDKKAASSPNLKGDGKSKSHKRISTPIMMNNIHPNIIDQFAHEEKHQGNFRLLFTEQNPGKYGRFLDKEYSLSANEEDSFLKKRMEPIITDLSNDYWPMEPQTRTMLKKTRLGQVYVETRPKTPGALDPHSFMQFKCSVENSPYRSKASTPLKKGKSRKRAKTRKPAFQESLAVMSGRRSGRSTAIDRESDFEGSLVKKTSFMSTSALSPNERVKVALEKLRQKNLQKFKFTAKLNEGMLRSATATSISETTSPYLIDAMRLTQQKSKKKLKKGKNGTNNTIDTNNNVSKPTVNLSELDNEKLPSVCQPLMKKDSQMSEFTPKSAKRRPVKSDMNNNVEKESEQQLIVEGKAVKAMCKTKKNDPSPKEPSSSMFDPISIDEEEERCRRRALTARKKVMDSLGIQETVLKVVKMTGAPNKQTESVHPKLI